MLHAMAKVFHTHTHTKDPHSLFGEERVTFVAFCSVATAFADKFVRFRLFKKLSLKLMEGVGTLLKFMRNDRNF